MASRDSSISLNEIAILDFETTGLSPEHSRIIEVAVVTVREGKVTDKFSQLMDPGEEIPYFITQLTGITNDMIWDQPSPEETMGELKRFIGSRPILAHNASFDRNFLKAEIKRAGLKVMNNPMLCSLLLARRLIPDSPNHKLGTLAKHLGVESTKRAHRALADVEVTAQVWNHLYKLVREATGLERPEIDVFQNISAKPKAAVPKYLSELRP